MKVLVCGGREYDDLRQMFDVMTAFVAEHGMITEVIHGNAKGADFLARAWAIYCGVKHTPFDADWNGLGKAAGSIRNQAMLDDNPTAVIAFPGGRGTADMVGKARMKRTFVVEILR